MIDYHKLKDFSLDDVVTTFNERDTMLYALALGLGMEPLNPLSLRYVYGPELLALPSYPVTLGSPGFFAMDPKFGIDARKLLHGEQHVRLFTPIPVSGTVKAENRITHVIDKGEKGAVLHVERTIKDSTDKIISISEQVLVCRGDGGFSSSGQPTDSSPPALPAIPDRAPDYVVDLATRPETALTYRLSGDLNPLHADPKVAASAGFPQPILHGLATFGIAMHAVLRCCNYEPNSLAAMGARFSAPAFPGDVIRTEIWQDGGRLHVRSSVPARGVTVLNNGLFEMTAEGIAAMDSKARNNDNLEINPQ